MRSHTIKCTIIFNNFDRVWIGLCSSAFIAWGFDWIQMTINFHFLSFLVGSQNQGKYVTQWKISREVLILPPREPLITSQNLVRRGNKLLCDHALNSKPFMLIIFIWSSIICSYWIMRRPVGWHADPINIPKIYKLICMLV